jgi:Domain of unknown function (DUF4118)
MQVSNGEISGPKSERKNANGKEAWARSISSLPSVFLLKVCADIRSLGQKFAAIPLIGAGSITFPIYMRWGYSGLRPELTVSAYAVAVMAVGGAVVATLESGFAVKHPPTLFFCSVMLSSWFGGVWPGVFAGLLSAIALDYYFIPPIYALGISVEEVPDMIAFGASALFVSWLSGGQKRAKAAVLFKGKGARESLPHPQTLCPGTESVFFRQGDYWTVQYQGQTACLRATRGLECLACLLEHPDREFHVSELVAPVARVAGESQRCFQEDGSKVWAAHLQDAGPILDSRAKAEYARRLAELRGELEDAERLNDPEAARKARQERDCIADQLAMAVGLGGRNRNAASQAERARSAVTKRIKDSINKIAEAIPSLGRHLATRVKTGYFCSYKPHPDRPFKWKVEF